MALWNYNHSIIPNAYAASQPMVVKCAFRAKVDEATVNKPPAVQEFLVIEEG